MNRKWTEIDSYFQEGYGTIEPVFKNRNGQEWTKMDSHFQEGYETFEPETKWTKWTEWTRNGQSFSGGIRTLLKNMESEYSSGVNRSRHFGAGTIVASQLKRTLRQNVFCTINCQKQNPP